MKKVILLVTICNFIAAGIGFFINVVLARHFSYDIYGRINLLLSINAIIITFLQFGFQNSMVIFHNKNVNNNENINNSDLSKLFFVNRQYGKYLLFLGIPITAISLIVINYLYKFSTFEIIFVGVIPVFLGLYTHFTAYYQAQGIWLKYNILNVLYNFLKALMLISAIFICFILKNTFTYDGYVYTFISYAIILFIIGVFVSRKYIYIGKKNKEWTKLLNKTLIPIGLTNLLIILIMRIDNILIERFLGVKQVAIYSVANTLAFFFPLFTSSIMRVLMREVSKDSMGYLKKILFYQKKYFIYAVFAFIVVYIASPYLISFLFGEKYISSIVIFQILSFVYIGGIFFTPLESYFYTEDANKIFILKIIQLILITLLGILFMKLFELPGLAIAVVVSRIIAWGYLYIKSKRIVVL